MPRECHAPTSHLSAPHPPATQPVVCSAAAMQEPRWGYKWLLKTSTENQATLAKVGVQAVQLSPFFKRCDNKGFGNRHLRRQRL